MTRRILPANASWGRSLILGRSWRIGLILLPAATLIGIWLATTPWNSPLASSKTSADPHASASAATPFTDGTSPHRPLAVATRSVAQAGPPSLQQQFTGIVAARRTTRLAAKALGRVEQLFVDLGDQVKAGEPLVQLDRAQLQAARDVVAANLSEAQSLLNELKHGPRPQELQQSEARLQELQSLTALQQAQLARTETLRGSAAISRQELDETRFQNDAVNAQLLAAQHAHQLLLEGTRQERIDAQQSVVEGLVAQLRNLDIQLEEKRIVAPYTGHIQSRLVDEGAIVSAGEPLLEIVESGALEVHVGLPNELAELLSEDSLSILVGQRSLGVSIERMAPTIQAATRTREVVLRIKNQAYEPLAIGSAVQVLYRGPVESQGHWLPTAALTAGARGLWAVFVAVPASNESAVGLHHIERRQVELLRSQGEWSEVRGPLDAKDLLVVDGVHRIVAGQAVMPMQQRVADEVDRQVN